MQKERTISVNCVQAVLTVPLQYSDYVLRLHDGTQWEYTKTANADPSGLLRWGQTKTLTVKSNSLTVQLVGSADSSIQITGFVNIDLDQITENAVECFGISNWHKQKIGALVLIFSMPVVKRKMSGFHNLYQESTDYEESTKESSVDDIDEGSTARKPLVPSFEPFRGKLPVRKKIHCSPFAEKYGPCKRLQMSPKPFLASSRPAMKTQWNNCITPNVQANFNGLKKHTNPLLQTQVIGGSKNRIGNGAKPGAFKNLKFGEDCGLAIPRRARSGDKKEVEQNINFHFWLSPRENQQEPMPGIERNLLANSLNNKIKVVINKGSIHHHP